MNCSKQTSAQSRKAMNLKQNMSHKEFQQKQEFLKKKYNMVIALNKINVGIDFLKKANYEKVDRFTEVRQQLANDIEKMKFLKQTSMTDYFSVSRNSSQTKEK